MCGICGKINLKGEPVNETLLKKVIATKSYVGIEDIIEHEKTGLLLPLADENALAESMFRLLNDEELRISLSMEAKKKVENFSIEKITKKYKKVLLDV